MHLEAEAVAPDQPHRQTGHATDGLPAEPANW